MIVLQLKSTQDPAAFENVSAIIKTARAEFGYRVRGHEIHQVAGVMKKTTLAERAGMVSRFCAQHEIERLTYHAPILGMGDNLWDDRRREKVKESIRVTVQEAVMAARDACIREKAAVVVVFHLASHVPRSQEPSTLEEKRAMLEAAEREFLAFYRDELAHEPCVLAVENTYPRSTRSGATVGPFHPSELVRLARYGIAATLDFAHYHLYSNYIKRGGSGNRSGDLDRQQYGQGAPPGWEECISILGDSLVQLHISDARGMEFEGEALPLGRGEIPLAGILKSIHRRSGRHRAIAGTLELYGGHLDGARLQLEGVRWIAKNAPELLLPA